MDLKVISKFRLFHNTKDILRLEQYILVLIKYQEADLIK